MLRTTFHQEGEDDEDMTSMHTTMLRGSHGGQGDRQGCPNKEEVPKLSASSHQGGGPNQVQVHLRF